MSSFSSTINSSKSKATLGVEKSKKFFSGNTDIKDPLNPTKSEKIPLKHLTSKSLSTTINASRNKPSLNNINNFSNLLLNCMCCTLTTNGPSLPTEINETDSMGKTSAESDISLLPPTNFPFQNTILLSFANFISTLPPRQPMNTNNEVDMVFNVFQEINDSLNSFPESNSKNSPIQSVFKQYYTPDSPNKVEVINQILNYKATSVHNIQSNPDLFQTSAPLYAFAWEYSKESNFKKIFDPSFAQGGMYMPSDDEDEEDGADSSNAVTIPAGITPGNPNRRSPWKTFQLRLLRFAFLIVILFCLFGLFENTRKLYANFQNLFDKIPTQDLPQYFGGEQEFSILVFLKVCGKLLFNSFDTTMERIRNTVSQERIEAAMANIADQAAAPIVNSWDFGITNAVFDVVGQVTGNTFIEQSNIIAENELDKMTADIKKEVKLDFLQKKHELSSRFNTIVYCLNGFCFSSLFLMNQYDSNVVGYKTVAFMASSLGSLSSQNPLLRVSSTLGSFGLLGRGIWRLATGTMDPNNIDPQDIIPHNETYLNIVSATGEVVGRIEQHNPLFNQLQIPQITFEDVDQLTEDMENTNLNEPSEIPFEAIPWDDSGEQLGGKRRRRRGKRTTRKKKNRRQTKKSAKKHRKPKQKTRKNKNKKRKTKRG